MNKCYFCFKCSCTDAGEEFLLKPLNQSKVEDLKRQPKPSIVLASLIGTKRKASDAVVTESGSSERLGTKRNARLVVVTESSSSERGGCIAGVAVA